MTKSRAADDFDFIRDKLKNLDVVESTSTTQQPTKERPRAVEDVDVIKKRIDELLKEQDTSISGAASEEYPNAPIGYCFPCQMNKTSCDGSCSWG